MAPALPSAARISIAAVVLLSAAYALPLFVPPAAVVPAAPPEGASWATRVFPGVPAAWVIARLACLFLAAAIVAGWTTASPWSRPVHSHAAEPTLGAERLALALAALHVAAGCFGGPPSLAGQLTARPPDKP